MVAFLRGVALGMFCLTPVLAAGDVPVSWDAASCPAGTWSVSVTATAVLDAGDSRTFTGQVSAPSPFTIRLDGLPPREYRLTTVTQVGAVQWTGQPQTIMGDYGPPIPTPTPTPTPTPVPQYGFTLPTVGSTVRGDFTVTPVSSTTPFRIELLKPDGTLALPAVVRSDSNPFTLLGAAALPSGSYALVLKTTANQTPPAASVSFTLDNAPPPPPPTVPPTTVDVNSLTSTAQQQMAAIVAQQLAQYLTPPQLPSVPCTVTVVNSSSVTSRCPRADFPTVAVGSTVRWIK